MRRQEDFQFAVAANQNAIIYTQDYDQVIIRLVNQGGAGTFSIFCDCAGFSIPLANAVAIAASVASNTMVFTRSQSGSFPQPAAGQLSTLLPLSNFLVVVATVPVTLTIAASAQV